MTDFLATVNAHPRDAAVHFVEQGHTYHVDGDPSPQTPYTSVTTLNHANFKQFDADAIIAGMMAKSSWCEGNKYWGMTAQEIKDMWSASGAAASALGTEMHANIELFMNNSARAIRQTTPPSLTHTTPDHNTVEWQHFIAFVEDHPDLVPYRTEWVVYHEELKIAGSIDMVCENPDGTLTIYDWKRTKQIDPTNRWRKFAVNPVIAHIPDTNYWHYAIQLNSYKAILEEKYGKTVSALALVRLHPDAATYEVIPMPDLQKEIREMWNERKEKLGNVTINK